MYLLTRGFLTCQMVAKQGLIHIWPDSESHHLGRAQQEQLISALVGANLGQLKEMGLEPPDTLFTPGIWDLDWETPAARPGHRSSSLCISVVSPRGLPNMQLLVNGACQFRAPKVVHQRAGGSCPFYGPALKIT